MTRLFNNRTITTDRLRHLLKLNECCYSRNFNFQKRSAVFCSHFDFTNKHIGLEFTEDIHKGNLALWQDKVDEFNLTICLQTPRGLHRYEGELCLVFLLNGTLLFNLSFVFLPSEKSSSVRNAALVTRLQGSPGHYESIKLACKLLGNLNISSALLSALSGICESLEIRSILGVPPALHPAYTPAHSNFASTYHRFWQQQHAMADSTGLYCLSVPLQAHDFLLTSHKKRSQKHWALKTGIAEASKICLTKHTHFRLIRN